MTDTIKEYKIKQIADQSNKLLSKIPSRYQHADIETAKDYDLGESYYIFGGVGSGKTYLAYAIFKKDIKRQYHQVIQELEKNPDKDVYYSIRPFVTVCNLPSMLQDIRESMKDNKKSDMDFYTDYEGTLVIDDLGVEKFSEWVVETLYIIINQRYENELPTIIISNLSLKELSEKVGDRITSRIAEMCEIKKVEGEDKRLKK